jgi:hypothetical protein
MANIVYEREKALSGLSAAQLSSGQTFLVSTVIFRNLGGDHYHADNQESILPLPWDHSRQHFVENHKNSEARR